MPRLSADIITTTEVGLSLSLRKKLKAALSRYQSRVLEAKRLKAEITQDKTDIETMFADADEYAALESGVRVQTPFGEVPLKMVQGMTARKLNITKILKKFKLTPDDLEDCYDEPRPKKAYLGVWLPGQDNDDE